MKISSLRGLEILDSRGRPTLGVRVELSNGVCASAQVPSGASRGRYEALELRDHDPDRWAGLGVRRAVENVEQIIAPALVGWEAAAQQEIDGRLIELDGGQNKANLGANAILGVSCAVARAAAIAAGNPLWRSLAGARRPVLPCPMVNILSGGLHAGKNIEFQDFLVVPRGVGSYSAALEAAAAIHRTARDILDSRGFVLTGVADEGGWGPLLKSNEEALAILTEAIERAGYRPGDQVAIAIDVAASHFHADSGYRLESEGVTLSPEEMIGRLEDWCCRYPVVSLEDALEEDDWNGWKALTARLGARVQLVGDDFFTTSPARVGRGIRERAANAVLVKMNQIGTLTETFEVIDISRAAGFSAVISARSGETEDSFLADLAVASGAGQIKVGSVTRSERLAKYNRLLEIEAWEGVPYVNAAR